jgi:hypothetical protein
MLICFTLLGALVPSSEPARQALGKVAINRPGGIARVRNPPLMHDLLYIVTIVLWIAAAWLTSRPAGVAGASHDLEQAAAQQRFGCVISGSLLLFVVAGTGIGYAILRFIADAYHPCGSIFWTRTTGSTPSAASPRCWRLCAAIP